MQHKKAACSICLHAAFVTLCQNPDSLFEWRPHWMILVFSHNINMVILRRATDTSPLSEMRARLCRDKLSCRVLIDWQNAMTGTHQGEWLALYFRHSRFTNDSLKKDSDGEYTPQGSLTATARLFPLSFTFPRIQLHLLQVLHHGGERSDVSEDYTKEWVTHLFWPLSTSVPPHSPTPFLPSLPYPSSISILLSLCNPAAIYPPRSFLCPPPTTHPDVLPFMPSISSLSSPPRCTLSAWLLSAEQVFEIYSAHAAFKCLRAAA